MLAAIKQSPVHDLAAWAMLHARQPRDMDPGAAPVYGSRLQRHHPWHDMGIRGTVGLNKIAAVSIEIRRLGRRQ